MMLTNNILSMLKFELFLSVSYSKLKFQDIDLGPNQPKLQVNTKPLVIL